ncbi:COG1361 S-layer family protein [Candidatus Woesearchaeota archaeon]|nr:COG1361 S-layer family protein [Candidatus Woesearchaeota archaeon]
MKKIKQNIVIALLVLIFAINFVYASPAIRITLINQDPSPANPGKYVDLKFQIENVGDEAAKNVVVELMPEYPFTLENSKDATKTIGSIAAGRQGDDATLIQYKVRVDDKAVAGYNTIKVRYKKTDLEQWTYVDYDVNIASLSNEISVYSIKTIPEELSPGTSGKLEITLENMGYKTVRDISLRLVLAAYDGQTFANIVPIATLHSTSEKKLGYLEPNQKVTLTYDIIAEPNAESNIYKVPMILTYYDSDNQKTENSDIIGIVIGDKPELTTQISDSEIKMAGQKGKVTINIVNKGVTDASFVNAKVIETEDFSILSTEKEVYIGGVDSDDYEDFDVEIFVNPTDKEKIQVPVELTYKDPNNKEYSEKVILDLNLYTLEKAKELGLIQEPNYTGTIVIAIVIIGLIVLWQIKKRKPKRK